MEQVLAEQPRIRSHLCSSIPFKGEVPFLLLPPPPDYKQQEARDPSPDSAWGAHKKWLFVKKWVSK